MHHIVHIHIIGKEHRADYKNDLVPVCPNCHAMLHRKENGKYLSVDELKKRIQGVIDRYKKITYGSQNL